MCDSRETWQAHTTDELDALNESNSDILKHLKNLGSATYTLCRNTQDYQKDLWIWQQGASKIQELSESTLKIDKWIEVSEKISLEQHFLRRLAYERMEERHSQIAEAHTQTFQWIFKPRSSSRQKQPPTNTAFTSWLKFGNGIFWVTGKPGSGKSTLMKFIFNSEEARVSLREWAGDNVLVTAPFFFWSSGTEMQKSHEGLLRSLLFRALAQFPSLIPVCFPYQWSSYYKDQKHTHFPWTKADLLQALSLLIRQTTISARFCFFVDGLDEYSGEYEELIHLLCDIAETSQNFKICLSSRPWNVFQTAFRVKNYPRLFMEHLTQHDIRLYVQNTLAENTLYQNFLSKVKECDDFVTEVVERANGVFLWVYLVVKSLLEGLRNEDKLSTLQKRLRILPTDLEQYFQHMLNNIEDVYQQQAAESFQYALSACEPLTLLTFSLLDDEAPQDTLTSNMTTTQPQELSSRYKTMEKRINVQCKDLLEVTATGKRVSSALRTASHDSLQGDLVAEDFFVYRVDFLHRTVRDFLNSSKIKEQIKSKIDPNFDPHGNLCLALLAQIKSIPIQPGHMTETGPLSDLVDDLAHHARLAETRKNNPMPQMEVLDELAKAIIYLEQKFAVDAKIFYPTPASWRFSHHRKVHTEVQRADTSFLAFAARKGLGKFVMETLAERPSRTQLTSLVRCALHPSTVSSKYSIAIDTDMIKNLLQCVPDDGEPPDWTLVFADLLISIAAQWESFSLSNRLSHLSVLRTFQESGYVHYPPPCVSSTNSFAWADFLLMFSETWTAGSIQSVELSAEIVEFFLNTITGNSNNTYIDPNTIYKGSTLWGHFVRNLPGLAPRKVKARLLRTVQLFLDRGADTNFNLEVLLFESMPTNQDDRTRLQQKGSVREKLEGMYTAVELAKVGFYQDDVGIQLLEENEEVSQTNYFFSWIWRKLI